MSHVEMGWQYVVARARGAAVPPPPPTTNHTTARATVVTPRPSWPYRQSSVQQQVVCPDAATIEHLMWATDTVAMMKQQYCLLSLYLVLNLIT